MLAALALGVVFAAPVPADPPAPPPKGPAPTVQFCKLDGARIVATRTSPEYRTVTREIEVTVNGQPLKRTVLETVPVPTTTRQVWRDMSTATFATAGGTKLTQKEAMERLKDGTVCVVSANGEPVDPAYLRAFKADTLVVVTPRPGEGPAGAPAPRP